MIDDHLVCGEMTLTGDKFDEITVERINIVEADGTVRLTLANNARFPDPVLEGTEHERVGERGAGMLFFDDAGTEIGGLNFSGRPGAGGTSLTFDRFGQDQTIQLVHYEDGDTLGDVLMFTERPATPMATVAEAWMRVKEIEDEAKRARELKRLQEGNVWRMSVGCEARRAGVDIADTKGRVRISLFVGADDEPRLQFLDAEGNVTREFGP